MAKTSGQSSTIDLYDADNTSHMREMESTNYPSEASAGIVSSGATCHISFDKDVVVKFFPVTGLEAEMVTKTRGKVCIFVVMSS